MRRPERRRGPTHRARTGERRRPHRFRLHPSGDEAPVIVIDGPPPPSPPPSTPACVQTTAGLSDQRDDDRSDSTRPTRRATSSWPTSCGTTRAALSDVNGQPSATRTRRPRRTVPWSVAAPAPRCSTPRTWPAGPTTPSPPPSPPALRSFGPALHHRVLRHRQDQPLRRHQQRHRHQRGRHGQRSRDHRQCQRPPRRPRCVRLNVDRRRRRLHQPLHPDFRGNIVEDRIVTTTGRLQRDRHAERPALGHATRRLPCRRRRPRRHETSGFRRDEGQVLGLALVFLVFVALVLAATLTAAASNLRATQTSTQQRDERYAAEAGILAAAAKDPG